MRSIKKDLEDIIVALNQNPNDQLLQERLADHFFSQKIYGNAVEYYGAAIKANPDCLWNQLYLAKAFYYSGHYRKMEVLLEYIFEQKSFPLLTYILRAHLHCVKDEYQLAEEAYLKAVKINRLIQDKWLENQLWGLKYKRQKMSK